MEEKKQNKSQATIEILDNGPLVITGNIIINDLKRGIEDFSKEVWLCRCGLSETKPYCDRSHKK